MCSTQMTILFSSPTHAISICLCFCFKFVFFCIRFVSLSALNSLGRSQWSIETVRLIWLISPVFFLGCSSVLRSNVPRNIFAHRALYIHRLHSYDIITRSMRSVYHRNDHNRTRFVGRCGLFIATLAIHIISIFLFSYQPAPLVLSPFFLPLRSFEMPSEQ